MTNEVLEIVTKEILEELKSLALSNAELISIVKRLFEKVEHIERSQNNNNVDVSVSERIRAIQLTCKSILEKEAFSVDHYNDLKRLIEVQAAGKDIAIRPIIKHRFYFKPIKIIVSIFFLIIIVLTRLYMNSRKEANEYKASDIKYRFLKLHANTSLNKVLSFTDSLYLVTPDSMKKEVMQVPEKNPEQPLKTFQKQTIEKKRPK